MCSAHHGFSKSNTFYVTSRVEALGGRHCASSRYSVTEDSSRILPRQRENEGILTTEYKLVFSEWKIISTWLNCIYPVLESEIVYVLKQEMTEPKYSHPVQLEMRNTNQTRLTYSTAPFPSPRTSQHTMVADPLLWLVLETKVCDVTMCNTKWDHFHFALTLLLRKSFARYWLKSSSFYFRFFLS